MGFHSSFCLSLSRERDSLSHQVALSNLPLLDIHSPPTMEVMNKMSSRAHPLPPTLSDAKSWLCT